MKLLYALFALCLLSCGQGGERNNTHAGNTVSTPQKKDSLAVPAWIDAFRNFREALYRNDRRTIRTFFEFPLQGDHNEIWYLVNGDGDLSKPFIEADFDRHYEKIFPPAFLKALLKIKSTELNSTGSSESPEGKEGTTSYKLYTTVDSTRQNLSFNLAYETPYEEEVSEHNVIYHFRILPNGRILFEKVNLAG